MRGGKREEILLRQTCLVNIDVNIAYGQFLEHDMKFNQSNKIDPL